MACLRASGFSASGSSLAFGMLAPSKSLPGFVLRSQPVRTDDSQNGIARSYLAVQVVLEVPPDRDVVDIHKELIVAKLRGE